MYKSVLSQKPAFLILKPTKKLVFSIPAPYGRNKNDSFCDHPLDFFSGLLMKNLIYRGTYNILLSGL